MSTGSFLFKEGKMAKKPPPSKSSGGSFIMALIIIIALVHFHILPNPSTLFNSMSSNFGNPVVSSGTLGCRKLEKLFLYAGGSSSDARMMAAIAMAESGGNQYAYLADSNGTNDEGYWGINSANEGTYYPVGANRYDPLTNAKAAVAILHGVGYTAWVTYNKGMEYGHCGV